MLYSVEEKKIRFKHGLSFGPHSLNIKVLVIYVLLI